MASADGGDTSVAAVRPAASQTLLRSCNHVWSFQLALERYRPLPAIKADPA